MGTVRHLKLRANRAEKHIQNLFVFNNICTVKKHDNNVRRSEPEQQLELEQLKPESRPYSANGNDAFYPIFPRRRLSVIALSHLHTITQAKSASGTCVLRQSHSSERRNAQFLYNRKVPW